MSACALAQTRHVVVVGDDTDLLILLQHHFKPAEHNSIYLQTRSNFIDFGILQSSLDPSLSESLLFIHDLPVAIQPQDPMELEKCMQLDNIEICKRSHMCS